MKTCQFIHFVTYACLLCVIYFKTIRQTSNGAATLFVTGCEYYLDIDFVYCRSLFSSREFQILLREGRLEGITYTIAGKVSHVTQLTKIEPGVWTHIAIRVCILYSQ